MKIFIKEIIKIYNKSPNENKKKINKKIKKIESVKKFSECEKCLSKETKEGNKNGLSILLNIFTDISKLIRLFIPLPFWLDKLMLLIEITIDNLLLFFK